jgi:splicing factor 3B subunit 3
MQRIFTFNDLASNTSYKSIPLQYTPRKLVGFHEQQLYYVIESDNNTMDADTQKILKAQNGEDVRMEDDDGTNGHSKDEDEEEDLPPVDFGYPRSKGMWASCIQVVDPVHEKAVIHTVELGRNQSAVSAALVSFESRDNEYYLAVGIVTSLSFSPFQSKSSSIHLYKVSEDGRKLEFYHSTDVDEPPLALLSFKGKLIAGVGRDLSLFDCGKKSLLRKAQAANCTATRITGLCTQGSRLIVSDQSQSITFVVHKDMVHPNRLIPFADDTVARYTTCADMTDYDTVVGGDKFGNLWMVRCPAKVSEASDESTDGQHLIQDKGYLGGAPNRVDLLMHYFTNDIPISVQKTSLIAGGEKVVFWAGLQGTLGALIPFESRRDFKMFQALELALRNDDKPISGRDHLAYRSYYTPVKSVLDGDLIERFLVLSRDQRESITAQLGGSWTSEGVEDAIWKMRALYAF